MIDPVPTSTRRWHIDWRLLLFSGLFLPLLLSLGFWQLERAEEKQTLLAQWQRQASELDWPEHVANGLEPGQPVALDGRYEDPTWLLDNRTRDGMAGYEVLTLFKPQLGKAVIVNRGWVRAPRHRDQLPELDTPTDRLALTGRLSEFPVPPVLMETTAENTQWPRRVQSLTRADAEKAGSSVASLVVRLDGPDQPGAYRADWAPDRMGPQTHYGYAVQWFSLAIALVILTLVASYRKTGHHNDNG